MRDNRPPTKDLINWRRIGYSLYPFSVNRITIFSILSRGDSAKEIRLAIISLKVFCVLCLTTIPLAIIALIIIFHSNKHILSYNSIPLIVICYFASILLSFLGYKWPRFRKINNFFKGFYSPWEPYVAVWTSAFVRIILCFEISIIYGFLIGLVSSLWFSLPLFVLGGISLALTYPTDKKWNTLINQIDVQPRSNS
jgi:hypothetical protein